MPTRKQSENLRVPPHSLEAERGVLGSILMDVNGGNRVIDLCTENGIVGESFFMASHSLLYDTLQEMARAGVPRLIRLCWLNG